MTAEWQQFILAVLYLHAFFLDIRLTRSGNQDTVIIASNVAFLAISSVDNGGDLVANRSVAQIASYVSTIQSLGSFLIALVLVVQIRTISAEEAVSSGPA